MKTNFETVLRPLLRLSKSGLNSGVVLIFLAELCFMQLFCKTLRGMANSVDPLICVYTVCICHFVRNFGVLF